jgi:hypothetical protein
LHQGVVVPDIVGIALLLTLIVDVRLGCIVMQPVHREAGCDNLPAAPSSAVHPHTGGA